MRSRVQRGTGSALRPRGSPVTEAAVAEAGRAAWTWRRVDEELEALLRNAVDERQSEA